MFLLNQIKILFFHNIYTIIWCFFILFWTLFVLISIASSKYIWFSMNLIIDLKTDAVKIYNNKSSQLCVRLKIANNICISSAQIHQKYKCFLVSMRNGTIPEPTLCDFEQNLYNNTDFDLTGGLKNGSNFSSFFPSPVLSYPIQFSPSFLLEISFQALRALRQWATRRGEKTMAPSRAASSAPRCAGQLRRVHEPVHCAWQAQTIRDRSSRGCTTPRPGPGGLFRSDIWDIVSSDRDSTDLKWFIFWTSKFRFLNGILRILKWFWNRDTIRGFEIEVSKSVIFCRFDGIL